MRPDFGGVESDTFEIPSEHTAQIQPAITNSNKIISILRMSYEKEPTATDKDWLGLLLQTKNVLTLGTEAYSLKADYLRKYPNTTWTSYEESLAHSTETVQAFDLLLIGTDAASSTLLAQNLNDITPLMLPEAKIIIALKNASSQQIIDSLIDCETTDNCSQTSLLTNSETPAHIYKALLDVGWSPSIIGHKTNSIQQQAHNPSQQVERARDLISMMDRIYIEAHRSPQTLTRKPGKASFTVVVPCTQEQQLNSNVLASAGLKEVCATIISIQGAHSPGDAISEATREVDTDWVLLAHQDVYFPSGFGEQLNAILSAIPDREKKTALLGFAGIGLTEPNGQHAPAGQLTDRLYRFNHGPSDKAVSLDEFAIIMHKNSVHKIDTELGWHLWATDLCLSSIKQYKVYPKIICLPIFHNSRTGWKLPDDFGKSTSILLKKYSELSTINTLCGTLSNSTKAKGLVA